MGPRFSLLILSISICSQFCDNILSLQSELYVQLQDFQLDSYLQIRQVFKILKARSKLHAQTHRLSCRDHASVKQHIGTIYMSGTTDLHCHFRLDIPRFHRIASTYEHLQQSGFVDLTGLLCSCLHFLNPFFFHQMAKEANEGSKLCVERIKQLLDLENTPPSDNTEL